MQTHEIVSREDWVAARRELLKEEKALTRARDALAARRRALPWVRVGKDYVFEDASGPVRLIGLFGGKRQLIVQHFMFGPGWAEGCVGCSFGADHVDPILPHLNQKDVAYVVVSRAPFAELDAFRRRMGWSFRWVSSGGNDFNQDFHVSFTPEQMAGAPASYNYAPISPPIEDLPGSSVFIRDYEGNVFHTYSRYARGGEETLSTYALLDITPLGRDEGERGDLGGWVRHHDKYGAGGHVSPTGRFVPEETAGADCPACAAAE